MTTAALPREVSIFWFRRDLRINDNKGLSAALAGPFPVVPIFIFDPEILSKLKEKTDARVNFIYQVLKELDAQFIKSGTRLSIYCGSPVKIFEQLLNENSIREVYTNHDYEPYAQQRDGAVAQLLSRAGVSLKTFKDQVIFEKDEVVKSDGKPYTVFTPYSRVWKKKLADDRVVETPASTAQLKSFAAMKNPLTPHLTLEQIGFSPSTIEIPSALFPQNIIKKYDQTRNTPAILGTSRLGLHLRFGTVSIRDLVRVARVSNETFLNELIWREFFMQILYHFPHVVSQPFKPQYGGIQWLKNEELFEQWCHGLTGYPLVDAGMRELNQTGFMHNRVRMVAASFLIKHLLINPKWGEEYFARKLLDFDLSANNGNWQWVAGSGCDAAPYFRVFNPELQLKKFDPDMTYVRKWVPEFGTASYPAPIVDHEYARKRVLAAFKSALG
jgi:deoxyribodipyrimidine photo-lyase